MEIARCPGVLPDGFYCERRWHCVRYRYGHGDLWLTPAFMDGVCRDFKPIHQEGRRGVDWIHIWPGGVLVCHPKGWTTFHFLPDGGFSIEVEEPPSVSWPKVLLQWVFAPDYIRLSHWRCPRNLQQWKRQIRWWLEDMKGEEW